MVKMPKAKENGIPQNIPGMGVVPNTDCNPWPYRLTTAMSAVNVMPTGTIKLRRGPQRGFERKIETRRLRTASNPPYCMKTIVT